MGKSPINNSFGNIGLPKWFISSCKWTWFGLSRFFFVILISVAVNLLATFLISPTIKLNDTVVGWLVQHAVLVGFLVFALVLIMALAGLVSRYPVSYQEKEVEQLYLKYVEQFVKQATNISTSSIQFEKVFVDLRFWPDKDLRRGETHSSTQDTGERAGYFIPQKMTNSRGLIRTSSHKYILPVKRLSFPDLWKEMQPQHPVSVILGGPGTGKSTLLYRLALTLARRGQGKFDTQWAEDVNPLLIPIYVKLGDYAVECARYSDANLSLTNYLKLTADRWYIPDLASFFEKSLTAGKCLLMLDGLDEVYDLSMRGHIEKAITNFAYEACISTTGKANFNRLLITSRITGYNLEAFPSYRHYTIAELGNEQILDLVRKWLNLNTGYEESLINTSSNKELQNTIEQKAKDLIYLFEQNKEFVPLTKNPLSLTILTNMQWKKSELLRNKVEVYQSIVRAFSDHRLIANDTQFFFLLEALAFRMQENGRTQISQREIKKALETLIRESKIPELKEKNINDFIRNMQEQTGIFIEQEQGSFGFLHRTFQEYMAARYILHKAESDNSWQIKIIEKVRHSNTLWREPFLLAYVCMSKENGRAARQMIETVIDFSKNKGSEDQLQDLYLAAECLIEAEPLTIGRAVESRVAELLFHSFVQAKHQNRTEEANQIEDNICRWLDNLPEVKYRPALLMILDEAIKDETLTENRELALSILAKTDWTIDRLKIALQKDEYTLAD